MRRKTMNVMTINASQPVSKAVSAWTSRAGSGSAAFRRNGFRGPTMSVICRSPSFTTP
jgi:hypothetical protein